MDHSSDNGTARPPTDARTSDADLLARHVAGDPEAFGELVRRHRDRLWAVALRTLGDREEAADAVQDALVSAYRSAHTFKGRSAVTTWLHRITVNACIDRARKAATRRTTLTDDSTRLEALLEPHESAAVPAERRDLHRELLAALAQLPVGTVKSRCARGRARLLPMITHLRPEGTEGDQEGRNRTRGTAVPPADDAAEAAKDGGGPA
ncbi:sigma-70 family RNA polymerase sigma factor [Streptomyces alkaliterrae]|uniref:Sigma-70 family RNA polymerase sigma factor n=1 Tax=Streptomyces alkaliterrae TaxID=2213162 RepID=A0A5P0YVW7_9ACTN|nr:sigma-70 family RNA polymerase sigma factor [Streptomyces alkaliterrae]MQS03747.1 sigma-70 family RNA polymerase sigma factor [Streptomyces alkaliterrae]